VYLGLLAEYQGITHLLRAAQALRERNVEAHFLIMGFPGEDRYRLLADRLGLTEWVTFTGAIRYEEAADYLSLGTVAVAPKLSLTEGNGKLLNYIAMGLPTVAYDSPVTREILGDLGIYAPRGDWTALSIEMEAALRDPVGLAERGRALRARAVCQHTWQKAICPLVEVYASLLR
jgi:glycosyltransferase involved in cell wall biosynthesis